MWLDWFCGKEGIEYLEFTSFESTFDFISYFDLVETLSREQTILFVSDWKW